MEWSQIWYFSLRLSLRPARKCHTASPSSVEKKKKHCLPSTTTVFAMWHFATVDSRAVGRTSFFFISPNVLKSLLGTVAGNRVQSAKDYAVDDGMALSRIVTRSVLLKGSWKKRGIHLYFSATRYNDKFTWRRAFLGAIKLPDDCLWREKNGAVSINQIRLRLNCFRGKGDGIGGHWWR